MMPPETGMQNRKRLDPRIISFVRHGRYTHQRSIFVVRGKKACDAVPILYGILDTVVGFSGTSSLLWCFHKSSGFSLRRQKLFKRYNRRKKLGTLVEDDNNALRVFIARTEVRFCYYSETRNILGKTFGACVLQDAAELTPNVLARAVETVQGRGLIFLLIPSWTSDVPLNEVAGEDHSFLLYLLSSLLEMQNCLIVDDRLDVNFVPEFAALRLKKEPQAPPGGKWISPDAEELKELQRSLQVSESPFAPLVNTCRTVDQAFALQQLLELIMKFTESESRVQSVANNDLALLTAARGRGKSAALGLGVVAALEAGLSRILVTSPSAENVATLLQFVLHGLQRLGLEDMVDFNVHYMKAANVFGGSGLSGKMAHKIIVQRRDGVKQTVRYVSPDSAIAAVGTGTADLLCIDEAAALPTPLLRQLLSSPMPLTFLATTVSGYEGTGHALVRLLQGEVEGRVQRINLQSSIRYAHGDPVEAWLGRALCLDAPLGPPAMSEALWRAEECELWAVRREMLFSWEKRVRSVLGQVAALLAVSDHVTSPDELMKMADGREQRIFLLLPPKKDWPKDRGNMKILAVIQAHMEGGGWLQTGQIIPSLVKEVTGDDQSVRLPFLVIHRVVTHPELRGRGFGTRAVQQLFKAVEAQFTSDVEEEDIQPRLLCPPNQMPADKPRFLAARFGLQRDLLRFFVLRCNFTALDVEPLRDSLTGLQQCLLVRAVQTADETYLIRKHARFVKNLACGRRGQGPYLEMESEDVRLLSGSIEEASSEDDLSIGEDVAEAEEEAMEVEEEEGAWWNASVDVSLSSLSAFLRAHSQGGQKSLVVLRGQAGRLVVPEIAAGLRGSLLWCCSEMRGKFPTWTPRFLRAALSAPHCKSLGQLLAKPKAVTFCSDDQMVACSLPADSYSVCVLETVPDVSPRLLSAAFSTIGPAGLLVVLLRRPDATSPLGERFLRSLQHRGWPLGAVLGLGEGGLALVNADGVGDVEDDCEEAQVEADSLATPLLKLCRGAEQRRLLIHLLARLTASEAETAVQKSLLVTGRRGAGKSSVLGFLAAAALASGRTAVLVVTPRDEPLQRRRVRAAVSRGLRALGLRDAEDEGTGDVVLRCAGVGRQRTVRFLAEIEVEEAVKGGEGDLILVDEVSGVAQEVLEIVKTAQCQTLHTAAAAGPGTAGGARFRRSKRALGEEDVEWKLDAATGRVEEWMGRLLALPTSPEWLLEMDMAFPHPERCSLWRVNRGVLLSGVKEAEEWLRMMHGVCAAWGTGMEALDVWSRILSCRDDWFVLMDPPTVFKRPELRVRGFVMLGTNSRHAPQLHLFERPGSEDGGYGARAIKLIVEHLRGELLDTSVDPTSIIADPDDPALPLLLDLSTLPPRQGDLSLIRVDVEAVKEEERVRMLRGERFRPTSLIRERLTMTTGLTEEGRHITDEAVKKFLRRFLKRGGGAEMLPVKTSFQLLQAARDEMESTVTEVADLLEPEDWHQLKQLGNGELLDFRSLRSALRRLCRLVFMGQLPSLILSNLHKQVLLGIAVRQLDFEQLATELSKDLRCHLEKAVLRMALQFAAKRLYANLRGILVKDKSRQFEDNEKSMETRNLVPGQRAILEMQNELNDEPTTAKTQKEQLLEIVETFRNSSESFYNDQLKINGKDELEFNPMPRKRGRERNSGGMKKRKRK